MTESNSPKLKRDRIISALLISLLVILVLALFLKFIVVEPNYVSGESMMPNFTDGEITWVYKLAKPQRGDVVVFYRNDVNKFLGEFSFLTDKEKYERLIKRVVALEGDSLWTEQTADGNWLLVIKTADGEILRENYYEMNGKPAQFYDGAGKLTETAYLYYPGSYLKDATKYEPYVVPQGCMFVLGDNRGNSVDSRMIGAVPLSRVCGKVL